MLAIPRSRRFKPSSPRINFSHPLARTLARCYMFNPGDRLVRELVHGLDNGSWTGTKRSTTTHMGAGALFLNPNTDRVSITGYQVNGAVAIEAWFQLDTLPSTTTDTAVIIGEGNGGNFIGLYINNASNKLSWYDNAPAYHDAGTALTVGPVYHGVLSIDGAGNASFYLNGAPDGTATITPHIETMFMMGSDDVGDVNGMRLLSVRVWGRTLSATEVRQLYNDPWGMFRSEVPAGALVASSGTTFTYTPTGGAQTGGSATYSLTKTPLPAGGAQTGGSATVSKTKTPLPAGGAQTGGAATYSLTKVPVPAGGAQTGGAAVVAKTFTYLPAGGAQTGGSATYALAKTYVPSGGAQTGGAAAYALTKKPVPVGGAQSGGAAAFSLTKVYPCSGGAQTGGTATYQFIPGNTHIYTPSGGAQTGGAAAVSLVKRPLPSGGLSAGGSASVQYFPAIGPTPPPVIVVGVGGGTRLRDAPWQWVLDKRNRRKPLTLGPDEVPADVEPVRAARKEWVPVVREPVPFEFDVKALVAEARDRDEREALLVLGVLAEDEL